MTGGSSSVSEISLIESLETAIKQLSFLQEDNDIELATYALVTP